MTSVFSPPVDRLPFAPPLERWKYNRGRSVYRSGGTWVETTDPVWSVIAEADIVPTADRPGGERTDGTDRDRYLFLGGRVYVVSDAVATTLTTAGYGSRLNIESAPPSSQNGYNVAPAASPSGTPGPDGSWV